MTQLGGNRLPANSTILRAKYVNDSVETMSPGRMIVALYDRCLLDLDRATAAIAADDPAGTHVALVHAQAIVNELRDSLDPAQWPAAERLRSLYEFMNGELVTANVAKDAGPIATVRELLTPLRDAWREAAGTVTSPGGAV
jgi:flagellar protein FliS